MATTRYLETLVQQSGNLPAGETCPAYANGASFTQTQYGGVFTKGLYTDYLCAGVWDGGGGVDLRCATSFNIDVYTNTLDTPGHELYVYVSSDGGTSYTKIIDSGEFDSSFVYPNVKSLSGTITSGMRVSDAYIVVRVYITSTRSIYVNNMNISADYVVPTAGFTVSPDPPKGNAPLSVTFTDTSVAGCPPSDYVWDFDDGDLDTTSTPGSHTYTDGGHYNATQTVSNIGGNDVDDVDVYVWEAITDVDVYGNSIVELNRKYRYSAVPSGGYGYYYTYAWTVAGSGLVEGTDYDFVGSKTASSATIMFYTNNTFTPTCTVQPKTDGDVDIGSSVNGTITVTSPDPPMSSRMRNDFCLVVDNTLMEIR